MAIYRGAGGAGDATNDATSQSILAAQSAQEAAASEAAAASSASSAATSASNAASSATSAASSATSASNSASSATTQAANAASSAATATTKASEASTSATNAASSASAAATSATNAASSATAAANSATSASNSVSAASTSASNAATYASNAAASETNAASSANSASNSATSAAASATSAGNSASSATTSATNAANSASAAATSASAASTSATNAANSATSASTSAANAANSATAAASSATAAAGSATSAANSATAAASSASDAADSAIDAQSSEDAAAAYAASINPANFLTKANNLSDLTNTSTARNNLGVAIGTDVQAYSAELQAISNGGGNAMFKNRIINGDMRIDQRNAGASVTPAATYSYNIDRWATNNSQTSKYTIQQNAGSVTPPAGFSKYLGITSSSAYSVVATDYFYLTQAIEGLNIADLAWGTPNAQSITLSFLVRSSLTGTFGGSLRNGSANRSYPFSFTVSSSNTWTTVSVTIAGDTSGSWATDNSAGMYVSFGLGVGSNYSSTAGSWAGANYISATGATSVVGTNGATFYITGVQLEKGSTATSFDYRPYGTELALCQRYYVKYGSNNADDAVGWGFGTAATSAAIYVCFPVKMRSTPSSNGSGLRLGDGVNSPVAVTSVSNDKLNTLIGSINANTASGLTAYRPYGLRTTSSSGYLEFSSEL